MAIDYPNGLPIGLHSGRTYQVVSPLLRTRMKSGRAKQRRLYGFVPEMADIQWLFSGLQGAAFEAWWRDVLVDGSLWFSCPLEVAGAFSDYDARFTDVYSGPTRVGPDLWSYSAQLELKERPLLPPGWGEFPNFILESGIIDIAINDFWPLDSYDANRDAGIFDTAVNENWPEEVAP